MLLFPALVVSFSLEDGDLILFHLEKIFQTPFRSHGPSSFFFVPEKWLFHLALPCSPWSALAWYFLIPQCRKPRLPLLPLVYTNVGSIFVLLIRTFPRVPCCRKTFQVCIFGGRLRGGPSTVPWPNSFFGTKIPFFLGKILSCFLVYFFSGSRSPFYLILVFLLYCP